LTQQRSRYNVLDHRRATLACPEEGAIPMTSAPKDAGAIGSAMSRRGFLRATAGAVGAVGAARFLTACGGGASEGGDAKTLNVLTWQTYHNQPWLNEFTKSTGIKINAVNVGSPAEMFSKLKASPNAWDVALVTSGWFKNYTKEDLLAPIDHDRVKALSTMKLGFDWQAATTVQDKLYGVLYNWGEQSLAWMNGAIPKKKVMSQYVDDQGMPTDWNILWDPAFRNKVSLFDDPTSVLPMVPLALGIKDPFNLSDAQFAAVKKKLMELRPQVPRLTSGYDDQTQQFATGEANIGYLNLNVTVNALQKLGKKMLVNNRVSQGVPSWSDNYAVTQTGSKKADSVYKFINTTLALPWQARFIGETGGAGILDYAQATSPQAQRHGLTQQALDATLIPATRDGDEFFSKLVFFRDVENLQKRLDLWNDFKLGLGG
jgi:spermidine/putrescine-binding protein